MKTCTMSRPAFLATLHLLQCSGAFLLPQARYSADTGAAAFLAGREELCQNGWAELDFDGSLCSDRAFARLTYDITHAQAVMRLTLAESTQWCLLAPTELLLIEQNGDRFQLERRKSSTLVPWLRETALAVPHGELTTLREQKSRSAALDVYAPGSEARAREIVEHLAVFFAKETENA